MPPHQKTVGVDAVGRTGNQGTVILPLFYLQVSQLIRQHCADLIDLVCKGLAQHLQHEMVAVLELVQIGK